jgi:hypothetical protein
MILPRYSLRVILVVTALCAVISLVVSQGLRGKPWAAAMSMGLLAVVATLVLGALAFGLIWAVTVLLAKVTSSDDPLRAARETDASRAKPPIRA